MQNLSTYACSAALCFAAGQAAADSYPIVIDTTLNLNLMFGQYMSVPTTGSGYYDTATGTGHWVLTADLSAVGLGSMTFEQDWALDSITGVGATSTAYNCLGSGLACSTMGREFKGSLSATPTPIGAGSYTFELATASLGDVLIDLSMGTDSPGVRVSIDIASNQYECVNEGALLNAAANITLINDAELQSVIWSIDGQPVASTETLTEYVSLGQHTIDVVATITSGEHASTRQWVEVVDTVAPTISAFFSDSRSGEVITRIESRNTSFVQANFSVSDDCDNSPSVDGFGGFSISNGEPLKIQGNQGKVELTTSSLQMKVEASDSSGNASSAQTSLSITP